MKTLPEAVRAFLEASRDEWGAPPAQKAMQRLQQLGPSAKRPDLEAAARLVTESLPTWPNPEAGQIALTLGMLVELGADARAQVEPLLGAIRPTLAQTLAFLSAVQDSMPERDEDEHDDDDLTDDDLTDDDLTDDEEEDDVDEDDMDDDDDDDDDVVEAVYVAVAARMPEETNAARAFASTALATIAALSRAPEGRAVARRDRELLDLATRLANSPEPPPNAKFLAAMLHVLDDERLLVLHPDSGRGFDVTIRGVADNFQLHTLLAAALVPLGLPGDAPSPVVAACARGEGPQTIEESVRGAFNLHHWFALGPDGAVTVPAGERHAPRATWIWNEGVPADIRAFEGRRVVVLGPPPYVRTWHGGRLFGAMAAGAEVTRELPADEVRAWCTRLGRAERPADPHVMHAGA